MSRNAGDGNPTEASGLERGLQALRGSRGFRGPVEPLEDEEHGDDHFAVIYETEEERFGAVVPFLRQGLERGEKCLYVLDQEPDVVVDRLRDAGIEVDEARESGALEFAGVEETYLRGEEFDPDAMVAYYADAIDETLKEWAGLRVTTGTDWIDEVSFEAFMEYEGRVNALFEEVDAMALCHYDRTELSAEVIRDTIRTHPHLIYDGTVCHNFYYTPPEELFGTTRTENEVDRMLGTVQDRAEAKRDLAEHRRFLRELHEITASPDHSFEEKLQSLFDLGCDWFDLGLGGLNRVDPDADRFEVEHLSDDHELFEPGVELPLSETYCQAAASIKRAASVVDPEGEGFSDITVYEESGAQVYLGTYVPVEDGEDRTLAFIAAEPRNEPFTEADLTYLELMGQWLKYELENRKHKAALQQSKEHFEQIFESSHDAIFIVDPATDDIVDANPAASEMLGYDHGELLSLGPSDIHPDEFDAFREFVDDVIEDGAGWTDELSCQTEDGGRIPAEISASRMTYEGRPVMLAAVRDISGRKARERSQRQLYEIAADTERTFDEKLRALLELGRQRFDIDVGGLARVDETTDLFEIEVIRGDHEHLVPGEQYPLSETYCREATGDGQTTAITDPLGEGFEGKLCYDRFGVRTYLGTLLELEDDLDRTIFFLSNEHREEGFTEAERTFHHLMGQWVKYELEREQYRGELEDTVDRLQQSNDRLRQFAYAASHDLQEPLRMVSSYLQLLENEHGRDLDEEARECIDYAVGGADRMRAMVDDLLAYARVEQSAGSFELVDCEVVLERVTEDLRVPIEENDATVTIELLPTVTADGDQLKQLFGNLVSNAVKYGGDGPAQVEVSAERRIDHWEFTVADDGIGIDPEKTDEIFEVFKRLHHADEYPGTGIGLALCQEIVDNHGGEIRVESEPGEGSTFHVTLPRHSSAE